MLCFNGIRLIEKKTVERTRVGRWPEAIHRATERQCHSLDQLVDQRRRTIVICGIAVEGRPPNRHGFQYGEGIPPNKHGFQYVSQRAPLTVILALFVVACSMSPASSFDLRKNLEIASMVISIFQVRKQVEGGLPACKAEKLSRKF